MKKEIKRLRLSRETVRGLQDSDSQKVVGGALSGSCQSCWWCTFDGGDTDSCDTT